MGKRKKEVVFSYRIIQKEKPQKVIYGRYKKLLRKYRSTDGRSQKDKRSLKNKGVADEVTPYFLYCSLLLYIPTGLVGYCVSGGVA